MGNVVLCRTRGASGLLRFEARRGWGKVVGLLGTDVDAEPVALCGCSSIHTMGMRYPIDVALVTRDGYVLASQQEVAPGKLVGAYGAYYALERPSSSDPWPKEGSWVGIAVVSPGDDEEGRPCTVR